MALLDVQGFPKTLWSTSMTLLISISFYLLFCQATTEFSNVIVSDSSEHSKLHGFTYHISLTGNSIIHCIYFISFEFILLFINQWAVVVFYPDLAGPIHFQICGRQKDPDSRNARIIFWNTIASIPVYCVHLWMGKVSSKSIFDGSLPHYSTQASSSLSPQS